MTQRFAILAPVAIAAALAPVPVTVSAQNTAAAAKETLLESAARWDGTPYKSYPASQPELTVLKLTIPPHTALPWHTHPMPNAGYVVSGELTLEDRATHKTKTVHAGEAFAEMVNQQHRGINNGDVPTVLVLTYSGTPGEKTTIPAPGQKAEY